MKKLTIVLLAIAITAVFAAPSFAMLRKDLASVKGVVVSVNAARTTIVVKDSVSGKDVSFSHAGLPAEIVAGKPVIVLYKVGTNNATTVRIVQKPGAAAVTPAPVVTPSAPKATTEPATKTPEKPSKYGW